MISCVLRFLVMLCFIGASSALNASIQQCAGCHQKEVDQWSQSQHAVAMSKANSESVLGDFTGSSYRDADLTVDFLHEGDKFLIRVEQSNNVRTWRVRYTFGVYPLQQYLIDIGKGRLQAFNVAWDSRVASAGGQRWFRLDKAGANRPGDPMHWTGIYQNWNNQCADCHTTGLKRNYDPVSDSYQTTWERLGIGCVACHETAEKHANAARKGDAYGAGVELAAVGTWLVSQGSLPPHHAGSLSSTVQVPTCGRCHSLRTSLADPAHGQVHDTFSLTRLNEPLYFSDGRVNEEVFIEGSFEQSKMFQAGVVCSNCHNPHSGKLKASGNAVCTQCHNANDFDTSEHHHHPVNSEGSQCINCHMPKRTFMKIDERREHNFKVPRPDIAKRSGSPDVCLGCHTEKDRDWSIHTVENWFPQLYERKSWYEAQQGKLADIEAFLTDRTNPAIRRATLLESRGPELVERRKSLVSRLAVSDQAVIRESAFRVLRYGEASDVKNWGEKGLEDPSMAVRFAAFESLSYLGVTLDSEAENRVRRAYEHYLDTQSDLPSGRVQKARYLLAKGKTSEAERELTRALDKDPVYAPAALLLTNIMRGENRNNEAIQVIDTVLASRPNAPQLIHVRGLINLKLKQYSDALKDLERAAGMAPKNWLFGYRYAVVLFQLQHQEKARQVTEELLQRFPGNPRLRALMQHL